MIGKTLGVRGVFISPEQVEYSETEVTCSLFNMIKHSVSRVFEYLLEDEDNSIKGLA